MATGEWDRRTLLAWVVWAPLLLTSRGAVAAESAVAVLQIDGMT